MAQNRGKKFEYVIREAFERVPGVSLDRLNDNTAGFKGIAGICDFIVYKEPYEYYIECKSVHGNTLPFSNITDKQWNGLLQKSQIEGVFAGVICWWIDKDITLWLPIRLLAQCKEYYNMKSYSYDCGVICTVDEQERWQRAIKVCGKKKRVFFDYDMEKFLNELS